MILGLDPGIRKLGFALITPDRQILRSGILVDQHGGSRDQQFDRRQKIHEFFAKLFAEHPITTLAIEKYFFTQTNQSNAEFVFGTRALLITLARQHDARVREFTPQQLKKGITGTTKAPKSLIVKTITRLFQLQESPQRHDIADALGLALLASRKF